MGVMISKLTLKNFRGFDEHELTFRPRTVAVGRNNAGKSTVIEALRLISAVSQRYVKLTYRRPPEAFDIPMRLVGASFDVSNLNIDFGSLFYLYSDPPAVIAVSYTHLRAHET